MQRRGRGRAPTCVSASRRTPMPPARRRWRARLSGDSGAVGTRHCARSDLPWTRARTPPWRPRPRPSLSRRRHRRRRGLCGCVALPPITTRSARRSPAGATGSPWHVHRSSGTLTTRQSSSAALASMISTWQIRGHKPRASRLNLITVNRYWSSAPYRLRSRLVLYSFPSSSDSWCLRSSSGTRCVPVERATTFVRLVFTDSSFRMFLPP